MLNKSSPSIEPCATAAIIFSKELNLHEPAVAYRLSNCSWEKVSLFQTHKSLIWQIISYSSMCQALERSIKIAEA